MQSSRGTLHGTAETWIKDSLEPEVVEMLRQQALQVVHACADDTWPAHIGTVRSF